MHGVNGMGFCYMCSYAYVLLDLLWGRGELGDTQPTEGVLDGAQWVVP